MRLLNSTPLLASCVIAVDPDGRERAVVVVKGTFGLPQDGGVAPLASEQAPFVYADTFTGEPGRSAVIYASEFAPYKPRCDLLVLGAAHAPGGEPVTRLEVGVRIGRHSKRFEAVGERHWTMGALGLKPSRPKPFTRLPLSYDVAFGGATEAGAYLPNPVGRGYALGERDAALLGHPAPNTQELGRPLTSPRRNYQPMAFGPLGRNFGPRLELAGTFDAAWLERAYPLLPADFSYPYFQSAPADQQISYPEGGEAIELLNLSPAPAPPFYLPPLDLSVSFVLADETLETRAAVVDTLILEPELARLQLIWRTSLVLASDPRDLVEVAVGAMSPGWHRARRTGKLYFRSLAELMESG